MEDQENYKIIITDNNPIVVEGFISLLKQFPEKEVIGIAHDGGDLLVLLKKVEADTLFLDLNLPSTNIYRLIKDLVVEHSNLKIIAFSSYTMPKLVQDVMEFGVHAYLSKTASLNEIIDAIDRVHKDERFISISVYQKDLKSRPEDNQFSIDLKNENAHFSRLTEREMDIVTLLSRGYSNIAIAEKLYMSKQSIETHQKNVMKKLKLKNNKQLVYFAEQQGLV